MSTLDTLRPTNYVRAFDAVLAAGDGRTLDARVVPYNVGATVADPPDPTPYTEVFLPGAFERQVSAPDRMKVWLNFEHDQGLRGIVGHGVSLSERKDGLYGSFRVHENSDGDKALGLVRDGLLTGLSIEFAALRSRRTPEGIVQRLRAHISKVALCRFPAYAGAEVLALREAANEEAAEFAEQFVDEHGEPREPTFVERLRAERAEPLDPALVERVAAFGIEPLQRVSLSQASWDGSPARFTDEEYMRSTLFCRSGDGPPKERCSLPVLEPSGALNVNALGPAAGALAGGRGGLRGASSTEKAAAARKLIRYYNAAGQEPPPSLRSLASSG